MLEFSNGQLIAELERETVTRPADKGAMKLLTREPSTMSVQSINRRSLENKIFEFREKYKPDSL